MGSGSDLVSWPFAKGEMASRIRSRDWSATPLGPAERWPQSLRTAVDLMLALPGPATILWGPSHLQFYNDAYIAIAQHRHPALLGRPVEEGWADAYREVIASLLDVVQAGETKRLTDFPVMLSRKDGSLEERAFDTDWSPLRDESGSIAGAFQTLTEVTDRYRTEAALRASEARFRALVVAGSSFIYRMSPDWRLMYQLDGGGVLAPTGEAFADWTDRYILLEDRAAVFAEIERAIATQSLFELEHRVRRADGGVGWVLSRAVPIIGLDGQILEWFGAASDVSTRRLAETRLRDSESQLAAAFESVPVGAAVIDVAGEAHFSNAEYRRFLPTGVIPSRGPENLPRWRAWDASGLPLKPSDFPGARALRGERVVPGQEMLYTDDKGRDIWTSVATVPTRDAQGAVTGVVTTISDIDIAKRSGEALRDSEERLRQFGDASSDVLWIRDAQSLRWTYLTPAFEMIYGLGREEALSGNDFQRWVELILPEDRDKALAAMDQVRNGAKVQFEYRIRRPDDGKVRWLRNTDFPIRNRNGAVIAIGGIGHDVTIQKEASSRMEVLVAELQHRTRNLIAVVRAIADRTADRAADLPDFLSHYYDRLGALSRINGLLSQLGKGERITFDEMLRTELSARGFLAGEKAGQIVLDGPAGLRLRSATVQTFALAIHELTTNAVKYGALSKGDGRLHVSWRMRQDEAGLDHLYIEWIETDVSDMPADEAPPRDSGYGRTLIEQALPYQLDASTTYELASDGVRCTIDLPLR